MTNFRTVLKLPLLALAIAACGGGGAGGGISGVYVPTGQSPWTKFDFRAQNKVDVSNFAGQTVQGEYAVMDDGRIRVMASGEVLTLKQDSDGCLVVTTGDAEEARQAERMGATEEDLAEIGHFCKQ